MVCLYCFILHFVSYITDTIIIYRPIYSENQGKYMNVICNLFKILIY
jgi:hypothetical protein